MRVQRYPTPTPPYTHLLNDLLLLRALIRVENVVLGTHQQGDGTLKGTEQRVRGGGGAGGRKGERQPSQNKSPVSCCLGGWGGGSGDGQHKGRMDVKEGGWDTEDTRARGDALTARMQMCDWGAWVRGCGVWVWYACCACEGVGGYLCVRVRVRVREGVGEWVGECTRQALPHLVQAPHLPVPLSDTQ
jgi:hypothetical protein